MRSRVGIGLAICLLNAAAAFATLDPDSKVAVLDGYQFVSYDARTGVASSAVDLRRKWQRAAFFSSPKAQGREEYPHIDMLEFASGSPFFLAAVHGGPAPENSRLVVADGATGAEISTIEIADNEATASFLPSDPDRLAIAWYDHDRGTERVAIFTASTGQLEKELPVGLLAGPGVFLFAPGDSKCLYQAADGNAAGPYRVADLRTGKFVGTLELPGNGKYSLLNLQWGIALLQSWEETRRISVWPVGHPEIQPREVARELPNTSSRSLYFLAGGGRVLVERPRSQRGTIVLHGVAGGGPPRRLEFGQRIRQISVAPRGDGLAFAVGADVVVVDSALGGVTRVPNVVKSGAASVIWVAPR